MSETIKNMTDERIERSDVVPINEHLSDDEDDRDELDEAIDNCGGFFDGRVFVCMNVGSEQCDWDCPFSKDIGMTKRAIQRRDMRELARAVDKQRATANGG